jgi:hypothetical protein
MILALLNFHFSFWLNIAAKEKRIKEDPKTLNFLEPNAIRNGCNRGLKNIVRSSK